MQDYISSTEASSFTGVSPQTLQRFAEAGYLKIETDSDGLPLFSKNELIDVFGLDALADEEAKGETGSSTESAAKTIDGSVKAGSFHQEGSSAESSATTAPISKVIVSLSKAHVIAEEGENAGKSEAVASFDDAAVPPTVQREIRELEREVARLSALSALQERLLESRDAELKDLKTEREWLKSRVERLEEKSDRDQLLLLSETQVVRKLITMQQEKKSMMRVALDWLGITAPITTPQQTIELSPQAANQKERGQAENASTTTTTPS